MRKTSIPARFIFICCLGLVSGTSVAQTSLNGDLNLVAGVKFSERYLTDHLAIPVGVNATVGKGPFYFEAGLDNSYFRGDANPCGDNANPQEGCSDLVTLNVGASFMPSFQPGRNFKMLPFIGAGPVYLRISSRDNATKAEDEATSLAYYFRSGVFFRFFDVGQIGVEFRAVRGADVELFGNPNSSANYNQISVFLGYHWGMTTPALDRK